MKRVMLGTKNVNDMTSFLRAMGVFTHPTMKPHVQIVRQPEDPRWVVDWSHYWEVDLMYIHRPCAAQDYHIIDRAKQLGVPVWVDLDDDLENITADNPVYGNFNTQSVKDIIKFACNEADVLTVGGAVHQSRLERELKREVILIPNAIDDRLLKLKKPFSMNKKIAWRGSDSHRTDLLYYKEELEYLMQEFNNEWVFFGLNPYFLDWSNGGKYKWVDKLNLMDFYVALTSFNASFHMHPMVDTVFNRVKSNLCYSDATLAGSVIIAPDFPEYRRPGVFNFIGGDRTGFKTSMELMLNTSEKELKSHHDIAWEWICDNILMSKVNQQRLEILNNL